VRRRFWQFVHNQLELAWHWVYYHKLAPKVPIGPPNVVAWRVTFITKEGFETEPSPPWQFVHNQLELAWHLVYYHKLAPKVPIGPPNVVAWRVTFITKEGFETEPSPPRLF
jgi:hypothetical protein